MNIQEINLNNISKKLYKIPRGKLAEVNDFIDFILNQRSKTKEKINHQIKEKILSFAGIWKEMSKDEFDNFMIEIKGRRGKAFSRRRNETSLD